MRAHRSKFRYGSSNTPTNTECGSGSSRIASNLASCWTSMGQDNFQFSISIRDRRRQALCLLKIRPPWEAGACGRRCGVRGAVAPSGKQLQPADNRPNEQIGSQWIRSRRPVFRGAGAGLSRPIGRTIEVNAQWLCYGRGDFSHNPSGWDSAVQYSAGSRYASVVHPSTIRVCSARAEGRIQPI